MTDLSANVARLLGIDAISLVWFASGDLSSLYRARLPDGRHVIVKSGPAPMVEADMLRAIAMTGAPAPAVIAADETVLLMEEIAGRSGPGNAQADLGTVLAKLHAPTDRRFGWPDDYAFGRVTIHNRTASSWVEFWRDNRIVNNLPHVPRDLARRLEHLAGDLGNLIPDQPPAALVHGDLWSGNVMSIGDRITALIDPASYYGDGEVDLAMLSLFGRLDRAFFDNYRPLEPGFAERQPVYSLWPALVHLRLFGEGYRSMVEGFLYAIGH
ncbi:fructosamine kinase family protein [Martelella alba]|uniref:Fructosamine kinase family protein n=1 Tax=Martelella alba TaxID=2590451 RepID=A0A506UJT7_9HYPH|nr:fructosamine kinase family protein [Martelella alba]TPW33568.1 fructosamine kinase family protein [Martelella alba]